MVKSNINIELKYKLSLSYFEELNSEAYATQTRSLALNLKFLNKLLANDGFCKTIMPSIIGTSPNNVNWMTELTEYLSSKMIGVTPAGYKIKLTCFLDNTKDNYKTAITEYCKNNNLVVTTTKKVAALDTDGKPILKDGKPTSKDVTSIMAKSENEILEHIISKVEPIDWHNYFYFNNLEAYLDYIFVYYNNQVANSPEDADKSTKIRFYIHDLTKSNALANKQSKTVMEAIIKLDSIKDDNSKVSNLGLILGLINHMDYNKPDIETNLFAKLLNKAQKEPQLFIDTISDEKLDNKVTILKYIATSILERDANGLIKESNTSNIIGSNMNEAVEWFINPLHEAIVGQFEKRYRTLTKINE